MKFPITAAALMLSTSTFAAQVELLAVPQGWKLESYMGGPAVVIWYAGSVCANGAVTLPATSTTAEQNRLYSTILAAKTSNTPAFVIYDNAQANCPIMSFGLPRTVP